MGQTDRKICGAAPIPPENLLCACRHPVDQHPPITHHPALAGAPSYVTHPCVELTCGCGDVAPIELVPADWIGLLS